MNDQNIKKPNPKELIETINQELIVYDNANKKFKKFLDEISTKRENEKDCKINEPTKITVANQFCVMNEKIDKLISLNQQVISQNNLLNAALEKIIDLQKTESKPERPQRYRIKELTTRHSLTKK